MIAKESEMNSRDNAINEIEDACIYKILFLQVNKCL